VKIAAIFRINTKYKEETWRIFTKVVIHVNAHVNINVYIAKSV